MDGDMEDMEQIHPLLQELGKAINDSLANNNVPISDAVGKIREAGYDVFMVLEATIGIQKRETGQPHPPAGLKLEPRVRKGEVVPGTFTANDDKLLREFKIRLD